MEKLSALRLRSLPRQAIKGGLVPHQRATVSPFGEVVDGSVLVDDQGRLVQLNGVAALVCPLSIELRLQEKSKQTPRLSGEQRH